MEIETSVDIAAPPALVWETLLDFEAYPEWNPFVRSIEGTPATGQRLRVRLEPPESRGMTFKPRVTALEPAERFEWLGHLGIPGLFDGRHEFRLERLGPDQTRFHHGETFSGLLAGVLLNESSTRAGFEAMNESLRTRAESLQAEVDEESGPDAV